LNASLAADDKKPALGGLIVTTTTMRGELRDLAAAQQTEPCQRCPEEQN
jgi:hypothetical protein